MSSPLFTVVIPTRDRNPLLAQCLDRLAPGQQTLDAARYEVVVTDDSVTEAARALVTSRYPWARWSPGPRRGPAANRNAGARAGAGDLVVFVDDDCLPERDLLAGYAGALRDGTSVYEGRITCLEGVTSPRQTAPENLHGGVLWSCNFAIRRDDYLRLGGFDERFPHPHMEDVDLRDRIAAAALPSVFVPEASVDHPPRRLPFGARLARMHQAGVLYMTLHPPVRSLPSFLLNEARAKLSLVRRRPKSRDSLIAIASLAVELVAVAWQWRRWVRWAARVAAPRT